MRNGNFFVRFIFFIFVAFGIITFKEIDVSAASITLDELHSEFQANTAVTKSDGYWDTRLTILGFNFVRQHQFYSNYNSHIYTYVITDKKMKNYGSSVVGSFDSSKCIVMVVKKFDDGTEYVGGFGFSEDRYFLNYYGYDTIYETAYNCPNSLENVDSSWINETLSDIDVSDVNTYPVGSISFIKPSLGEELYLNFDSDRIGYYLNDCKIGGKIPFKLTGDLTEEKIREEILYCLNGLFKGSIINNGKTIDYDENSILEDGLPFWDLNLKLFGNILDWKRNGYITFEYTFDLVFSDTGDTTLNFTFGLPVEFEKSFLFGNVKETKEYSCSTSFNIKVFTDLNGDGVDDSTGEIIPPDYGSTPAGDTWEDKSLIEKIEYLFTSIPNMLSNIFSAIINSIKYAFQCLGTVLTSGSQLGSMFSNIFGIFPEPIPQLVTLCIFVIPFIALFSWIKK